MSVKHLAFLEVRPDLTRQQCTSNHTCGNKRVLSFSCQPCKFAQSLNRLAFLPLGVNDLLIPKQVCFVLSAHFVDLASCTCIRLRSRYSSPWLFCFTLQHVSCSRSCFHFCFSCLVHPNFQYIYSTTPSPPQKKKKKKQLECLKCARHCSRSQRHTMNKREEVLHGVYFQRL